MPAAIPRRKHAISGPVRTAGKAATLGHKPRSGRPVFTEPTPAMTACYNLAVKHPELSYDQLGPLLRCGRTTVRRRVVDYCRLRGVPVPPREARQAYYHRNENEGVPKPLPDPVLRVVVHDAPRSVRIMPDLDELPDAAISERIAEAKSRYASVINAVPKRFARPADPDARRAREVRQGVREVARAMKAPRLSLDDYRAQQAWFEANRQDCQQRKGG